MNKLFTRIISRSVNSLSKNVKLASTYKAAVLREAGKPLEIQEKKPASLKPTEVRIRVVYCSVNSVDVHKFKSSTDNLPFIPGYELSGEVIERGKDVKNEQIINGEKVLGLSLSSFGGFAEQCVLDINDIWRIPGDLERKDAAVIAYGHSTALFTFSKLATIKEKDRVIITAGPAGMGLAAIDIAANVYKANVIGLVDTEERGELVRQRGAFETVAFSDTLTKECMKITDNKGTSIVYDATGEKMDSIGSCVSVGGKLFHAAPYFYKTVPTPKCHSFVSVVSLKELRLQNNNLYRSIVNDTLQLASDNIIGAHISSKYNLSQVNEAIKYIDDRKCTGKVLIQMDS
ncbi:unnamed protein product [Phyllotreta striolata]|uniref:Enoyl reductase (ER) domain-containing protein n=1 Tax=Phyllotreta striolata TaxID=444603 RepID=A0A9N9XR64_PHYSR|nr:unnamed protein product [Phyllotreta striolata]